MLAAARPPTSFVKLFRGANADIEDELSFRTKIEICSQCGADLVSFFMGAQKPGSHRSGTRRVAAAQMHIATTPTIALLDSVARIVTTKTQVATK